MKKILTLTAAALLWGTASFAAIDAVEISRVYTTAGYSDIAVQKSQGGWMVTATIQGKTHHFFVDDKTGQSREDNGSDGMGTGTGTSGNDGLNHDNSGNDNGNDKNTSDNGNSNDHNGNGNDASSSDASGSDNKGNDSGTDNNRADKNDTNGGKDNNSGNDKPNKP